MAFVEYIPILLRISFILLCKKYIIKTKAKKKVNYFYRKQIIIIMMIIQQSRDAETEEAGKPTNLSRMAKFHHLSYHISESVAVVAPQSWLV